MLALRRGITAVPKKQETYQVEDWVILLISDNLAVEGPVNPEEKEGKH